jgi:M6 family metalloprotease-like protein
MRFPFVLLLILLINNSFSQTINIAAIRVEFVEDSNPLTSGNGLFAVDSVTTTPFAVDPAPHNRTYFKDQIIAVDNYYNTISKGRVRITGDVFPRGLNASYKLPYEMRYYNPNTSLKDTDTGLAKLFIDAISIADSDPILNFNTYDLIVIFHAGVGRDIDLGFDETPQDIPSLYITRQFVAQNLDSLFSGIAVDGGNTIIDKAVILPETENQQGFQLGITGLFAANIGSYLGLYDLFSASEQRSGIGRFGLMDAGLFNVNGLIPAPPSAFSRKELGWEHPIVLTEAVSNVNLARFNSQLRPTLPEIIEIPLNEDEYFLLEYRGTHTDNIDSILFEVADQRGEFPEYMEILQTYFSDRIEISDSSGVLLAVDDYDLGMPGTGIIIWHIDNAAIRNASNRQINDNPLWRAVDIEEADGSEDIGQSYTFFEAGYQSELGWRFDYWHANNDAPLYRNEFSNSSVPNTNSNLNRAESNIRISNFSNYFSDVMTFDFTRDFFEDGFPVNTNNMANEVNVISGKIASSGQEQNFIFSINEEGQVGAFGRDGGGLFTSGKHLIGQVAPSFGGAIHIALMDTNIIVDGINDILIVLSGTSLYGFDLANSNTDTLAALIFEQNVGITSAIYSPVVVSNRHIFFIDGSYIQSYGFDGELSPPSPAINAPFLYDLLINEQLSTPINPAVGFNYLAQISENEILGLTYTENGSQFSRYSIGDDQAQVLFSADSATGQFSLTDLDGNGTPDILYTSHNGLFVYNQNGSPVINYPVFPKLTEGERLIGTPMIIDVSGSGDPLVIVTTNKGQIIGYNKNGKKANGFPVSAGGTFSHQAIPFQLDGDGPLELVAVSNNGVISAWEILETGINSKLIWANTNLNSSNNAVFKHQFPPSSVGNNLVPKNRFFNYPNPNEENFTVIRYYLNDAAKVKLRIFDVSGYKIDEFDGPGMAQTDNEVVWDVKNVASGVYVCQLEAESGAGTERRLIKIMVVH